MDRREKLILQKTKTRKLRDRVNGMCISCIYDPLQSGTYLEQIATCRGESKVDHRQFIAKKVTRRYQHYICGASGV